MSTPAPDTQSALVTPVLTTGKTLLQRIRGPVSYMRMNISHFCTHLFFHCVCMPSTPTVSPLLQSTKATLSSTSHESALTCRTLFDNRESSAGSVAPPEVKSEQPSRNGSADGVVEIEVEEEAGEPEEEEGDDSDDVRTISVAWLLFS